VSFCLFATMLSYATIHLTSDTAAGAGQRGASGARRRSFRVIDVVIDVLFFRFCLPVASITFRFLYRFWLAAIADTMTSGT